MRLKDDSVSIRCMTVGCLFGLQVANEVYQEYFEECVVTCGDNGKHSKTSLHYSGNAVDLRRYSDIDMKKLRDEIKSRLNIDYDVILEETHLHLEFQPRYKG